MLAFAILGLFGISFVVDLVTTELEELEEEAQEDLLGMKMCLQQHLGKLLLQYHQLQLRYNQIIIYNLMVKYGNILD